MKLLTFTIPCYNSQDYMRHCIESILPGGEDVEILIVDDGSKDDTAAIADEYAEKYPTIVKAIHQENGGHGEAVNAGIRNATGLYFKVVDSDDWVDWNAYQAILAKLREIAGGSVALDMLLANYVYEKEGAKHKRVMRQTGFPKDQIFTWSDVRHFYKGHYILMHSVIYVQNFSGNVDLNCRNILFMWITFMYISHCRMCGRCIIWMWIFTVILSEERISPSMRR